MGSKQGLIDFWKQAGVNEAILHSFEKVPREEFVTLPFKAQAYEDHPLPTIRKQSISQPTTIVMMLQALNLKPGEKVFEIGAGVGYQAAIISHLLGPTGRLVTTDVIPELVHIAKANIQKLGLTNVEVYERDGSEGFAEKGPFDKVVITAACPTIPQPLVDQMKEGAIVLAPVGDVESQTMVKGVKENGRLFLEFLGPFRFVPMKGKFGFKEVDLFYN